MLKNEDGTSIVEFAIIAPLLFVILFGIIEFGVLLFDKAMLTNAVREGARAGIVYSDPRPTDGDIEGVVRHYCENHLISFGTSTLNFLPPERAGSSAGDSLTVRVKYDFHFLVFSNILALLGGDIGKIANLNAEAVMRLE